VTLGRLMIAFAGTELPPSAARRINEQGVAGVTLFRVHNIVDPPGIRRLTAAIQTARPAGAPPLLVAADQEGGQLVGLGEGTTQFAGAMALGATGDEQLAERVAGATARELRALGVNVNYAPVCDVANNPANPALGIRSFGDDPEAVGTLAAATVGACRTTAWLRRPSISRAPATRPRIRTTSCRWCRARTPSWPGGSWSRFERHWQRARGWS